MAALVVRSTSGQETCCLCKVMLRQQRWNIQCRLRPLSRHSEQQHQGALAANVCFEPIAEVSKFYCVRSHRRKCCNGINFFADKLVFAVHLTNGRFANAALAARSTNGGFCWKTSNFRYRKPLATTRDDEKLDDIVQEPNWAGAWAVVAQFGRTPRPKKLTAPYGE